MLIAVMGKLGEARNVAVVSLSIDFRRPLSRGDLIIGASVRAQGSSLIYTECSFSDSRTQSTLIYATAAWAFLPASADSPRAAVA
jgi:acyl-coenzyme A thioesterase PaaI-like protein